MIVSRQYPLESKPLAIRSASKMNCHQSAQVLHPIMKFYGMNIQTHLTFTLRLVNREAALRSNIHGGWGGSKIHNTSTHYSPPKAQKANSSSSEQISILFRLGAPIAPALLLHTIQETERTMANLIGEYGDIQVLADADAGYFTAAEVAEGVVNTLGSI